MRRMVSLLAALAVLGACGQTWAGGVDPTFTFTYTDLAGDVANGTLSAVDSGLGDGSLLVTSGSMTVTSNAAGDPAINGTYTIFPAGPNPTSSPSGSFVVDDLIYPSNNSSTNPNGVGEPPPSYLTNDGLLFVPGGALPGSQQEVNIWANGGGDYAFFTVNGPGQYNIQTGGGGTFTLTEVNSVPEPASLTLLGLGIASVCGYGLRRRKVAA